MVDNVVTPHIKTPDRWVKDDGSWVSHLPTARLGISRGRSALAKEWLAASSHRAEPCGGKMRRATVCQMYSVLRHVSRNMTNRRKYPILGDFSPPIPNNDQMMIYAVS